MTHKLQTAKSKSTDEISNRRMLMLYDFFWSMCCDIWKKSRHAYLLESDLTSWISFKNLRKKLSALWSHDITPFEKSNTDSDILGDRMARSILVLKPFHGQHRATFSNLIFEQLSHHVLFNYASSALD